MNVDSGCWSLPAELHHAAPRVIGGVQRPAFFGGTYLPTAIVPECRHRTRTSLGSQFMDRRVTLD